MPLSGRRSAGALVAYYAEQMKIIGDWLDLGETPSHH